MVMPNLSQNRAPLPHSEKPHPLQPPQTGIPPHHLDVPPPRSLNKRLIIGGAAVLLVILAVLAYFMFAQKDNAEPVKQSKLPKIWLNQHFGSETCADEAVCGDEADPDADGLSNYNEFKEGTNPKKADTDQDGLADGDEVNIYKTDPGLKYTDRREIAVIKDFNDGKDIADNYDPLTPGFKMTQTRLKQIEESAKTFGLHEPTITTLKNLRGESGSTLSRTVSIFIESGKFNPDLITVNKGDTVVWLNKDTAKHKVMSSAFQSPELETNQTFSFTFESAGIFAYEDGLNSLIKGTIEVK